MRTSEPYVEEGDGLPSVQAGDRVERDDGWWRAAIVVVRRSDEYHFVIHWHPSDPPPEQIGTPVGTIPTR